MKITTVPSPSASSSPPPCCCSNLIRRSCCDLRKRLCRGTDAFAHSSSSSFSWNAVKYRSVLENKVCVWGGRLRTLAGSKEDQTHQNGINILERRTQSISDPSVNLDSQQLGLVPDRLLAGLEQLRQHLHYRLQGHNLRSKFTIVTNK